MSIQDHKEELTKTAEQMVAPNKGILAADESSGTIKKRLASIGITAEPEINRQYRQLYFTTEGAEDFISGVIMFDETFRQQADDGTPFPKLLALKGILPGIKVDESTFPMPGSENEKLTKGLDRLPSRLPEYNSLGARFAKWRAVITIDEEKNLPTEDNISQNAEDLAAYAKICQEHNIVPIVEPEVLMDGKHSIDLCEAVTYKTLRKVFSELKNQGVLLEGMILKPNMVISALDSGVVDEPEVVAKKTVELFKEVIPEEVPGIAFLSGGQSDIQATENLNAMNKLYPDLPWELSFSYGRALQAPSLKIWAGKKENITEAQKAFYHRAKMNSLARSGQYSEDMEEG